MNCSLPLRAWQRMRNRLVGAASAGRRDAGLPDYTLDALEPRTLLAVTVAANGRSAAYTDVDGDKVTVTVSAGTLTTGNLLIAATGMGDQLQEINLSGGGFDGASLTVSVKHVAGGDGLANVGWIDSTNHDLGNVTIAGDLGRIDAGDATMTTPGLKMLAVRSMGRLGLDTQDVGGSLDSEILGPLGSLHVVGDLKDALVDVTGVMSADGKIGPVTIGGSIIGGAGAFSGVVGATGDMGAVKIGGDIIGGAGPNSGGIAAVGKLASVTIAGSLLGGDGPSAGQITSGSDMGAVKIGRDVAGGTGIGTLSGFINSMGKLASLSIGGSLRGGAAAHNGEVMSTGDMGPISIGHDILGSGGAGSGRIESGGKIGTVTIGHSIVGSGGAQSGTVFALNGAMGALKIGGDVVGGGGAASGQVLGHTGIASVAIGGSIIGGSAGGAGLIFASMGNIGPVTVGGSLVGGGFLAGTIHAQIGALGTVSVGGSLIGGAGMDSGALLADLGMGAVKVAHDVRGGAGDTSGSIIAGGKLASVTIVGALVGAGENSGQIQSGGDLGAVKIGQDVQGGDGTFSAFISSAGKIASIDIGGSLIGSGDRTARILSMGDMGPVKIAHDVHGGDKPLNLESGTIESHTKMASVTIGGSLIAGANDPVSAQIASMTEMGPVIIGHDVRGGQILPGGNLAGITIGGSLIGMRSGSGVISTTADVGPIKIGGDIRGGDGNGEAVTDSGTIKARHIASLTVSGSIIAGRVLNGGALVRSGSVHASLDIGAITVGGSLLGNATFPVIITAVGQLSPTPTVDLAIKSLTVGGRVEFANLQVGFSSGSLGKNADAQIGPVKVAGDWAASYLLVGVDPGPDGLVGTADDIKLAGDYGEGPVKDDSPLSKITSVTIGGQVYGTPDGVSTADHFGFVAEQLGTFSVGGFAFSFIPGPHNDTVAVGVTNDTTIREV